MPQPGIRPLVPARRLGGILTVAALLLAAGMALRVSRSAAESARTIPAADHRRTGERAGDVGGRRPRRRLLLGCPRRVPACRGRHPRGLRLCRRRRRHGALRDGRHATRPGTRNRSRSPSIPRRISYGRILQIYFSVAHDPTELNRQGPDVGTQYRSAIFPTNPEQARVAKAYIAQLNQAHVFDAPIVTKIEPGRDFYPAEDYHQDFLTRNPRYPYIVINDLPKIETSKAPVPRPLSCDPGAGRGGSAAELTAPARLAPSVAGGFSLRLQIDKRRAVEAVEPAHLQGRTVDRDQLDDRGGYRVRPHRRAQGKGSGGLHGAERRLQYQITARAMHPVEDLNAPVTGEIGQTHPPALVDDNRADRSVEAAALRAFLRGYAREYGSCR